MVEALIAELIDMGVRQEDVGSVVKVNKRLTGTEWELDKMAFIFTTHEIAKKHNWTFHQFVEMVKSGYAYKVIRGDALLSLNYYLPEYNPELNDEV